MKPDRVGSSKSIIYNNLKVTIPRIQSITLTYMNPVGYLFAQFSLRIGFPACDNDGQRLIYANDFRSKKSDCPEIYP